MNWHYVVIIGAVFIMFISMGSNPFEPPPGWVPPDEFKDGIRARIDGPSGGFSPGSGLGGSFGNSGGGFSGSNTGTGGFGSSSSGINTMQYGGGNIGGSAYAPNYGIGNSQGVGSYMPNATNPDFNDQSITRQNNGFQQIKPTPPANNNIPAPFQNLPGAGTPRSDTSHLSFPDRYSYRTNSGTPVKFSGSSVFTLNKNGDVIAMPDGRYNLADGRSITVRSGKNMFPVGGNEFN